METITCIFCGLEGEPFVSEDGWMARRCPTCGLVFLSPRPSPAEIEAIYRGDAAHLPADLHLSRHESSATKRDARHALRLIRRYARKGRLLELGPGSGAMLVAARDAGFTVAAIELNPRQATFIRDELGIECDESLTSLERMAPLDVIYHRDVLSHFADPIDVFKRMRTSLAPGGVLVFETGNGDFDQKYARLFKSFQFPDHLFFFSEASLRLLLSAAGFEQIESHRYGILPELWVEARVRSARGRSPLNERSTPSPAAQNAWLHDWSDRFRHFLRYGVGSIAPTRNRPFTVVTVARPK